ncbi:MAG: dihydrofolate reductase family protein [Actinophytocola sp.]|uniref:dihydrofolate reductase family protein n=1 Tax=Actinophytocola sp. TaxID=1872138 RepID=UPI003C790068
MTRTLIASVNVSIDGFSAGPGDDMSWLGPHIAALAPVFEGLWRGADTAVIGRTNFVGFEAYWPAVAADPAADPGADPRDADLARWLDDVEKVVVSRTLETTTWRNSRVARDLLGEVRALKEAPGRDIMVLNSASVIRQLLAAGLVDDLRVNLMPEIVGGGLRLFDSVPRSSWTLAGSATSGVGTVSLRYVPVS